MPPLKTRNEIVGILWIVYSGIIGFSGLVMGAIFLGFGGLFAFIPTEPSQGEPPPWFLGGLMGGMGVLFGGVFVVMGLLGAVSGWYTRKGANWARLVLAVLCVPQVGQFPFGFLVAVLTWLFLFWPEPTAGAPGAPPTGGTGAR